MRRNELYHHGVKGMRWGVWNEDTKARYSSGAKIRKTPEERGFVKIGSTKDNSIVNVSNKKDAKWAKEAFAGYVKTYNAAVEVMNDYLLPKINDEWKDIDIVNDEVAKAKYDKQVQDAVNDALNTVGNYAVYNSPSGELMISYDYDIKSGGMPAINLYSRNKATVRAKKLQEAEDRAVDRYNNDIDSLNKKFFESHGLSENYDLSKNKRLLNEYDNWMFDQYESYIDQETSKVK